MLRELEMRLATVLGADLPPPLAGRVTVRPDSAAGNQPAAQIAVRAVRPVTPDFGAVRHEVAPGDPAARRIVRLEAQIDIRVTAGGANSRVARIQALDALIYFLDAPALRSGRALRDAGDPGFLLDSLILAGADAEPALSDPVPADLTLTATGWFWPVGQAGQDGPAIAEARITQLVYPVLSDPDPARFLAGAAEADITLRLTDVQALSLRAEGPGTRDETRLAFQLLAADGSAGAGSLTNGRDLGEGIRSRPLADSTAQIRYRPPANPARDRLVVRPVQEAPELRLGPVLVELTLITEAPA
ncbi:hypothetical protein [Paracoccus ravus]|uniref:hypothetical protein n=1 Tax=Paracoccus ravus TaxID=2447760 RepID=UPI00106EE02C|nr:hypothetical protein [Paracoccus ravus]